MRLKDVTEFCPAYTGAARNDAVAFVPMEALRYDSIAQQEIPFEEARGKYTFFADGDLLFAKVTPCFENGNIAVANNLKGGIGFGSSEIFVLRAKPGLNNRYLFYVVQASPFMDGGCATMCGVGGLKRMSPLFPRTFEWEIPNENLQRKIVAYLDEKSAAIDARVAVLEKKLAAYKRLKTSIINRAVTCGLDPKAKLKDSGVEWIGKVSVGWEVRRIKDIAKSLQYGASEVGLEYDPDLPRYIRITDISQDGELRSDCAQSLSEDVARPYLLRHGDILLARSGATVGKAFVYREQYGRSAFAGYMIRCQVIPACADFRFVHYWLLSSFYQSWIRRAISQATIQNVGADKYANLTVPLPDVVEQRAIADYLDTECAKIDKMAELVTREIELYKRLKRSLINEVVTGKRKLG